MFVKTRFGKEFVYEDKKMNLRGGLAEHLGVGRVGLALEVGVGV